MGYSETCNYCGHQITAYSHHLNTPLVGALNQLVDFYEDKGVAANLQRDLNLTKNQYNNFQKLQYFNLVTRTQHGWLPTNLGIKFVYGEESCYDKVATLGKKVLGVSSNLWLEVKIKPKLINIFSIKGITYKKRPEYQSEKSKQNRLF